MKALSQNADCTHEGRQGCRKKVTDSRKSVSEDWSSPASRVLFRCHEGGSQRRYPFACPPVLQWNEGAPCRSPCERVRGRGHATNSRRRRPEREWMGCYVLGFEEIDQTQVEVVGGKGAHLGELSRIEGVRVPDGFCVTTDAFRRIMAEAPSIHDRLDRLSRLQPDDREVIRALSAEICRTLEGIAIPDDLAA